MKKIIKCIRYILIILIILNCIIIFNFSAEKSEKSNQTSGRVINTIIEINPKTKNLSEKEKDIIREKMVVPVRKTAHFTVYTSLGILFFLFEKTFEGENKRKMLISLMLAFLYACTDEIHQDLVPGRTGKFMDVCIDTGGALFGILLIFLICKVINKINIKICKKAEKTLN